MTPAFRALEKVLGALIPLDPEERRKVIEAVHALLPISRGEGQGEPHPAQDKTPKKKRKGR